MAINPNISKSNIRAATQVVKRGIVTRLEGIFLKHFARKQDHSIYVGSLRRKIDYFKSKNFSTKEAVEFAANWKFTNVTRGKNQLPYVRAMIRDRNAYVGKMKSLGYSPRQIKTALYKLREKQGLAKDGVIDHWAVLRKYRKDAVAKGWDTPEKRTVKDYQGKPLTSSLLAQQRNKRGRKGKSFAARYADKTGRW